MPYEGVLDRDEVRADEEGRHQQRRLGGRRLALRVAFGGLTPATVRHCGVLDVGGVRLTRTILAGCLPGGIQGPCMFIFQYTPDSVAQSWRGSVRHILAEVLKC